MIKELKKLKKEKKKDWKNNKDMETPLYKKMTCWKGYEPKGKKKSPSGKKTAGGKTKMVNNCVKK